MRRATVIWSLAALPASLFAATACNSANLTKRELVVVFAPTSSPEQHAAALHACAHAAPHASPEPLPTSYARASDRIGDVRFRIDRASDRDVSLLDQCLLKQPGVVGIQPLDASG